MSKITYLRLGHFPFEFLGVASCFACRIHNERNTTRQCTTLLWSLWCSYMFRLGKVATFRLCKSEVYEGRLLVAILCVRFKATDTQFSFFTLLFYTACWWLLCVTVMCSCHRNHHNKVAHWRVIFLSFTVYFFRRWLGYCLSQQRSHHLLHPGDLADISVSKALH